MSEIVEGLIPYATVVSSILGIAVLGLILRLSTQMRNMYRDRIDASQERNAVLEERVRLAEDRCKKIDSVNLKVTEMGAALGIPGFEEDLPVGVSVRDIGDNFSGQIAGRDIVDTINKIGDEVKHIAEVSNSYKQDVAQLVTGTASVTDDMAALIKDVVKFVHEESSSLFEHKLEFLFERGPEKLRSSFAHVVKICAEDGWSLMSLSSDYNGSDGCVLVFRRKRGSSQRPEA